MIRMYNGAMEMFEYTSGLPGANHKDILDTAFEIWENRTQEDIREEWGAFQVFDSHGNTYFKGDLAKELEINLNEQLKEDGHQFKLSVRQIQISMPMGRVPTQTYEIVVLDNPKSEAQDPIIDWMIENRQELN